MDDIRDLEPEPYVIPLSADGKEMLSVDTAIIGGWAQYFSDQVGSDRPLSVLLRIGPEGPTDTAPLEVREVRFTINRRDESGFASALLREVPIMRIEAAVNQPAHRERLAGLVAPSNVVEWSPPGGGRYYIVRPEPIKPRRPRLRIADPGGYRKPDDFYRQVAERYLWLAAVSARPAQELAEANGTPPATVHRWLREAKARGLLLLPSHRGDG